MTNGFPHLDFAAASKLGWRLRNAAVEAAVRECLNSRSTAKTFETYALAGVLDHTTDGPARAKLSRILTRIAPYLPAYASHDGPRVQRYGKTWQRWLWHGQCKSLGGDMED